jgi:hypothetical protein
LKIYLSGKMTGEKDYGKKLFALAAKDLRDAGHEVYSPAEMDIQLGIDPSMAVYGTSNNEIRKAALRRDCNYICSQADAIVMLPNRKESRGAIAEYYLSVAIGLEVRFWQPPTKKKKVSSTKQQPQHAGVA